MRLLRWYRSGEDAERRLPILSAYLGHVQPRPGDLDTALSDCNRALELEPETAAYLDSRALVYFKLGRFAEAIRDYDTALANALRQHCGDWVRRVETISHASASPRKADSALARRRSRLAD